MVLTVEDFLDENIIMKTILPDQFLREHDDCVHNSHKWVTPRGIEYRDQSEIKRDIEYTKDSIAYLKSKIETSRMSAPSKDLDFRINSGLEGLRMYNEDISDLESATMVSKVDEVMEWIIVSPILSDILDAAGEVMYVDRMCRVWGRRTAGEYIIYDSVIREVTPVINQMLEERKGCTLAEAVETNIRLRSEIRDGNTGESRRYSAGVVDGLKMALSIIKKRGGA